MDPAIFEIKTRVWGGKIRNIRIRNVRKTFTRISPNQCLDFLKYIFLMGHYDAEKSDQIVIKIDHFQLNFNRYPAHCDSDSKTIDLRRQTEEEKWTEITQR